MLASGELLCYDGSIKISKLNVLYLDEQYLIVLKGRNGTSRFQLLLSSMRI